MWQELRVSCKHNSSHGIKKHESYCTLRSRLQIVCECWAAWSPTIPPWHLDSIHQAGLARGTCIADVVAPIAAPARQGRRAAILPVHAYRVGWLIAYTDDEKGSTRVMPGGRSRSYTPLNARRLLLFHRRLDDNMQHPHKSQWSMHTSCVSVWSL